MLVCVFVKNGFLIAVLLFIIFFRNISNVRVMFVNIVFYYEELSFGRAGDFIFWDRK